MTAGAAEIVGGAAAAPPRSPCGCIAVPAMDAMSEKSGASPASSDSSGKSVRGRSSAPSTVASVGEGGWNASSAAVFAAIFSGESGSSTATKASVAEWCEISIERHSARRTAAAASSEARTSAWATRRSEGGRGGWMCASPECTISVALSPSAGAGEAAEAAAASRRSCSAAL